MPVKTSITGEIHSGIYPQRPVLHNTSRLIHFMCVFVVRKGRYGQIYDFYSILLPKKWKFPVETSITGEIHPENSPQSPAMDSTSRLINFSGLFVVRKGRYEQKCDFYSILLPKK